MYLFSSVEPTISLASNTLSVVEDDRIMMTCTVSGSYPASSVEWLKESVPVFTSDRMSINGLSELIGNTQLFNTISTLTINDALISDTGTYTCRTLPIPAANPILPSVMGSLAIDIASKLVDTQCVVSYDICCT